MPTKAELIIKRLDSLKTVKDSVNSGLQDLGRFCMPRKAYVTRTKSPGQKADHDVYDSTAVQAATILAAGLHSYLSNPSSKWFTLALQNEDLMDIHENRIWLKESEDRIYSALGSSNFSQQIHETYTGLGVFGTSVLYEEADPKQIIRFYSLPIGECYIVEDATGRVNTIYREFKFTAEQAFSKWGNKSGKKVMDMLTAKNYDEKIIFIHCVEPRGSRDPSKPTNTNMPYASYYVEKSMKHMISEGGFEEFPFFVSRFYKESDEVYGTSPAWVSYPEIRMVNTMSKAMIRATQKMIDPPLMLPHDGYVLPLKVGAGKVNYKKKTAANLQEKIETLPVAADLPAGQALIENSRTIIKRNFFVDVFMLLTDPELPKMTATEVAERVQEKMLILGPALGRMMNELLDPVVYRTFSIMARNGYLPPPPAALQKETYVVKYTSPLALAQKGQDVRSLLQAIQAIGGIAELMPSVLDKIDSDKAVDQIIEAHGVHPEVLRSDDEIAAIRQERAQAQAAQAELATLGAGAEIADKGAAAELKMKQAKEPAKAGV